MPDHWRDVVTALRMQVMDGIPEDGQAGAFLFGVGLAPAAPGFLFPGPGGVLEGGDVGLGVGHEAQDPAGGVADAGDVQERAVGVVREAPGGLGPVGGGVLQGDLALILDFREHFRGGEEFAFAVAYRQFQMVQAPG